MLKLAITFLVIGAVLALLGFGGIGGAFIGIAKILFFIAIALFVIFLVLGLLAGKGMSLKAISKAMTRSEESIQARAKADGLKVSKLR